MIMKFAYMLHDMPLVVGIMNEASIAKNATVRALVGVNSYKR